MRATTHKILCIGLFGLLIGHSYFPLLSELKNQANPFAIFLSDLKQEFANNIGNTTIAPITEVPPVSYSELSPSDAQPVQNNKTFDRPTVAWEKKNGLYDPRICDYLDFAVTGFAKCGTTTLLHRIRGHVEVRAQPGEWPYFFKRPLYHVSQLYKREVSKKGPGRIHGYKNPHDIQYPDVLKFYRKNCPNTKLVVTIRHPILWFQSFYNYAILEGDEWWRFGSDDPNKMLTCRKPNHVCATGAAFHSYLSMLGKTPMGKEELSILKRRPKNFNQTSVIQKVSNPVLLIENSQLNSGDEASDENFRRGLQEYLGLNKPFNRDETRQNDLSKLVKKKKKQSKMSNRFIKICDEEYSPLREELMEISRDASSWIRNYFMDSPEVSVLNEEQFLSLLDAWMEDPCLQS